MPLFEVRGEEAIPLIEEWQCMMQVVSGKRGLCAEIVCVFVGYNGERKK